MFAISERNFASSAQVNCCIRGKNAGKRRKGTKGNWLRSSGHATLIFPNRGALGDSHGVGGD